MRIPGLRGLSPWGVAKRAVKDFVDDDMVAYAAALAFRVLLALFPFAIFLLTLLGALGRPVFFDWLFEQAQTALPPGAAGRVEQVIGEVRGQANEGLLSFGIGFAVWVAATAVRLLMKALNTAYDVEESRPAWKRFALSIVYTAGLAAMLIVAAGLMVVGPQAATWLAGQLGFGGLAVALWTWLRWPAAALLLLIAVAVVYDVAPSIDRPFRIVTPGSVLAVAAWVAASLGFSFYVSVFGSYGATYGSLGGVVVMLLYFFISAAVLLFGAEVNAAIHHAGEDHERAIRDG